MIRLGHIDYANCLPVHALVLDRSPPPNLRLHHGVPSVLNAALAAREIDVAPSSSIEYARHAADYRVLPDLCIGSRAEVRSILLERADDAPLRSLDGRRVALPTASATSVVLLRILLERRWGVRPRYVWFDQDRDADPVDDGAAAALWIGDAALRRGRNGRATVDLGAAWSEWTGLPFVYALWQTSADHRRDRELAALHGLLLESRAYFHEHAETLAGRYAAKYGMAAGELLDYWRSLDYTLDASMRRGLERFYRLALELGEVPAAPALCWAPASP